MYYFLGISGLILTAYIFSVIRKAINDPTRKLQNKSMLKAFPYPQKGSTRHGK